MYKKICPFCGKEFESKIKLKKYCCCNCYANSLIKELRVKQCLICGKDFKVTHKNPNVKCCSKECSRKLISKINKKENIILYQDTEKTIIDISTDVYKDAKTIIDTEDYNKYFFDKKLSVDKRNKKLYVSFDGWSNLIHRIILNADKSKLVDHINGDTFDNRKCNLRVCTQSENSKNRVKSKSNTTGYKGVCLTRSRNKYFAQIMVNRKHYYIGTFDTKEEAAIAYNKNAIKYFGEFAKLNVL